jgi:hypothetical protein|tara:strand:- start:4309 stop:4584 length:276 start_codon:yes stop_codon:yes gene_type:complete
MTDTLTKTEAIGKITALAKDIDVKDTLDYSFLNMSEDDAYDMVANNVLTQMYETPEQYRETIMMASMTKILVESLVLKARIQSLEKAAREK